MCRLASRRCHRPPYLVRDDSRIFAQIFDASTIEEQRRLIESMAMRRGADQNPFRAR